MKLLGISSTILLISAGMTEGFTFTSFQKSTNPFQRNKIVSHSANILEGKEIKNEFTPINNMLLVKKPETIDQTEGGIFLTGREKINKSEGLVVSVGSGKINSETGFQYPMPVAEGETVYFGKYDGEELTYNDAKHTLIRDEDVLVKYPAGVELTLENVEVLWDNVLIKVEEVDQMESGGILIAETVKKSITSSIGEVLKVGKGKLAFNGELMEMDILVGDMVKFRDFAAQEVQISEEKYAVVRMTDLLAKF